MERVHQKQQIAAEWGEKRGMADGRKILVEINGL